MKKFALFTVMMAFVFGMNAQNVIENVPMPSMPKSNAIGLMPNGPKMMKAYENVGWVYSYTYLQYLMPSSYNLNAKRTTFPLFPDSCMNYVYQYPDKLEEFSTWRHAIGCSFDPYSESYDKMFMGGIFPTPDDPAVFTYPYRIDTVIFYGTYQWGEVEKAYNASSPDTLRMYLSYHQVYEQVGNKSDWIALHWTSDVHQDTAIFAPMVKVGENYKQQMGTAITPNGQHTVAIDYILGPNDTNRRWDSVVDGKNVQYYNYQTYAIPTTLNGATENGYEIPAGAVLSCIVKFIPGYKYHFGDTLEYAEVNPDNTYKNGRPNVYHNTFNTMIFYEKDDSKAFCDPYGYNFNFFEHKGTRYQCWMNGGQPNTLYNSMYYPNAQYLPAMVFHMQYDSLNGREVCDSAKWKENHPDSVGISEASNIIENIYPNPASDFVTVTLKSSDRALIRVCNVMGQVVRSVTTNEERNIISTKDLAAGMYILSVEQNGKRFNTKLSVR